MTRPPSSSARQIEQGIANRNGNVSAGSNGDGGRGVGGDGAKRPTVAGAARVTSPVVRGFSRRSNRKLVRNAMNFLCLAGGHLQDKKTRALAV